MVQLERNSADLWREYIGNIHMSPAEVLKMQTTIMNVQDVEDELARIPGLEEAVSEQEHQADMFCEERDAAIMRAQDLAALLERVVWEHVTDEAARDRILAEIEDAA